MSRNSGRRSASPPTSSTSEPPAADSADRLVLDILDNRLSVRDISPTGQLIRAIDHFNQSRLTTNRETPRPPPANQTNTEPSRATGSYFQSLREGLQELHDTAASLTRISGGTIEASTNTSDSSRPRPRMTERNRHLERNRVPSGNRHTTMSSPVNDALSSLADLHHAGQQLESASQHMRALLDDSQNILTRSSLAAEEYAGEAETNRAIKRRRLDGVMSAQGFRGFSYGYFGQVEPGELKMEIESCDGGTYVGGKAAYTAGNVLKNDNSVYCTKGNHCNLVLRHQGATPFCLTELSIKGPRRDYTDPVQEGMIFVSMNSDDLLARTAQYKIQYSPPSMPRRRGFHDPRLDLIFEIGRDADTSQTGIEEQPRNHICGLETEDGGDQLAQIPPEFNMQNIPPFHVTTECDDSDSDSGAGPPRRRLAADRLSDRLSAFLAGAPDGSSDSETSGRDQPWPDPYLHRDRTQDQHPSSGTVAPTRPRRHTRHRMSAGLAEAVSAAHEATQEALKAVNGIPPAAGAASALMTPLAWFFIERDKSKCTIKFDPPVSGRFILLKMWSPHLSKAGNIDIQSVVAKGFAGPRLFPAIQLR